MEKKFSDLMVDLETMSLRSTAAIIQIAAVEFDIKTGEIGRKFCINVDLEDCIKNAKLHYCKDTATWWSDQDPEVISRVFDSPTKLEEALESFNDFCYENNYERVWANPSAFDFPILKNAYQTLHKFGPRWTYKMQRDVKTLLDLAGVKSDDIPFEGLKHYAPDDCIHQTKLTVAAYEKCKFHEWRE